MVTTATVPWVGGCGASLERATSPLSSTTAPAAPSPAPASPDTPPPGEYVLAQERCASQCVFGTITIMPGGRASLSLQGWQTWTDGAGHLVHRGGVFELVFDEVNPESLTVTKAGKVAVRFALRIDGALVVIDDGEVGRGSVFQPPGWAPPPTREVERETLCPPGTEAMASSGGCGCEGSSTIENPCPRSGGGFPRVEGNRCIHTCFD